jgi:hypothetical protein
LQSSATIVVPHLYVLENERIWLSARNMAASACAPRHDAQIADDSLRGCACPKRSGRKLSATDFLERIGRATLLWRDHRGESERRPKDLGPYRQRLRRGALEVPLALGFERERLRLSRRSPALAITASWSTGRRAPPPP